METYARIPIWKAYLYSLLRRWRYYKALNANWIKLDFNREDIILLRLMLKTYVDKEVMRKVRTVRYETLIQSVFAHIDVASKEEIELAMRLQWVKHIKSEDLTMELKQIKEFGKLVGLKPVDISKMSKEKLIIEIIRNVKASESYPQEFIAWYEELDDRLFDIADTEDIPEDTPEEEEVNDDTNVINDDTGMMLADLIDVISELNSVPDLKEIATDKDFEEIFGDMKLSKYRSVKTLSTAMLEAIEAYNNPPTKEESEVEDIDDELRNVLIETINEIETEEELAEFFTDDDIQSLFTDRLEIEDYEDIDISDIKKQMLTILGVEEKEEEEEKPLSLKEKLALKRAKKAKEAIEPETSEDADELYAKAEAMTIPKLRKYAKSIGVVAPFGGKKADILECIADKLQINKEEEEVAESEEEVEIEITKSIVNDAVEAGDKETLIAMCEGLDIKLTAIMKKSINLMKKKLLEVVPDDKPAKRDFKQTKSKAKKLKVADESEPISEQQSIYQLIEEMVLEGNDESTITSAVRPLYEAKGKKIIYIKQRVKQMMEIISKDYDLK